MFAFKVFTVFAISLMVTTPYAQTVVPIQPSHSGSYYNPERSGEGWFIEILEDGRAQVIWYTYPPASQSENQQTWIIGSGPIVNDRILIDEAVITDGGIFGDEFNPALVNRNLWGKFEVTFNSQNDASIRFSGPAEYGSDEYQITRLIGINRLPVDTPAALFPAPNPSSPGVSGTWFDPSHSGEGLILTEHSPGSISISWFSYDQQGRQRWMIGTGQIENDQVVIDEMFITDGTVFGANFNPDDVNRREWGNIRLVFDDCDTATLTYNSVLDEFGAGSQQLQRLTKLKELDCEIDNSEIDFSVAKWDTIENLEVPALSEMPAAVLGRDIYIAGGYRTAFISQSHFWKYSVDKNEWKQLPNLPEPRDHSMMVTYDGRLYFFGGFLSSPSVRLFRADSFSYDPAGDVWSVITPMPAPRAAGTAVRVGEYIYLVGGNINTSVFRYDPRSDEWLTIPIEDEAMRDHSAAAVINEEIWILGGRNNLDSHNDVLIFNPATRQTRKQASMRTPRSGFAAAVVGGTAVVAGGEDVNLEALSDSAEYFDPVNKQWILLESMPIAIHGGPGVSLDQKFYVMLGSRQFGVANNIQSIQVLR